jgi:phosphorylcholine metabolism protein LicD|tara:strand:+ start:1118 stop:1357 length:240 start_codon:yes stop_codon:yes gene_type:complete
VEDNKVWIGESGKIGESSDKKFNGVTFPIADLERLITIKAYGKKFLSPANPEIYLEKVYGKNWKIPDKKQFVWNKKNLN